MKSAIKIAAIFLTLLIAQSINAQPLDTLKIKAEADSLKAVADSLQEAWQLDEALETYQIVLTKYRHIGDLKSEGKTLNSIGIVYYYYSNYHKALEHYKQSLEICKVLGDRKGEGKALNNIGLVYQNLSDYSKSLEYYQESLELFKELEDLSGECYTCNGIGVVYRYLGYYQKSLEYHQKSLDISRELGDRRNEGATLQNIGVIYFYLSKYSRSLGYFQKSLEIYRGLGNRMGEIITFNCIGEVYRILSDYLKALQYYNQSLAISRELGDRSSEGEILNNIGIVYTNLSDYPEALKYYQKSLAISKGMGDPSKEGINLYNIGTVYNYLSDYPKALEYYRQSLEIFREVGYRLGEGLTLGSIGEVYTKQGKYAEAEEYIQKALAIALELKTEGDIQIIYFGLGECYAAQGMDSLAVMSYAKSIETAESIRGKLEVETHKTSYMKGVIEVYEKMIKSLIKLGRNKEAYDYLERMKARALLDILEGGKIDFAEVMTDEEALKEKTLIAQLEKLNQSLADIKIGEEDKLDSLSLIRDEKREELEAFEEKVYLSHPELKELRGKGEPINLRRAQRILSRDEAAVYYVTTEEQLFIFILTRNKLEVLSQEIKEEDLNALIDELLSGVDISVLQWNSEISQKLFKILLEPIGGLLKGKERICIIPDGRLNYLPFQALQDEETGRCLIEDYSIYYAPSYSTLAWLRMMGTYGGRELLAFGNPVFGEEDSTLIAMRGELVPLPATEKEVKELENVYQPKAKVFLESEATESNFKLNCQDYGVLHFATHALVNEVSPLYSSIAFSKEESEDGFLEAREIMKMELNADLAVLSACKTAYGKVMEGEGMLGLTRAFFTAGVPSVVASLWNVEDNATRELMVQFHTRLREGERPAAALREAQLYLLKETQYNSPLYWAPFVLIGDSE